MLLYEIRPYLSSHSGPMKYREFYLDLCRAFNSAHIPLHKVNNQLLQVFSWIHNHPYHDPPDKSSLRKHYLTNCYDEMFECIRTMWKRENMGKQWWNYGLNSKKSGKCNYFVLKSDKIISELSFMIACKKCQQQITWQLLGLSLIHI